MKYIESQIDKKIIKGLLEMGFTEMTPIQEQAIPMLLEGRDVIGQAQTGTGKTAAFGIPMIERVDPKSEQVQGLILCPTRELAVQAAEELRKMAKHVIGLKVIPIYGGQDIERQIRALKGRSSIVVGTPGRVMDHMRRHTLKLENLKMFVLDEADEMLNMGFIEDIETICQSIPEERQTALFSATMPEEILEISKKYQKNSVKIKVKQEELTMPLITQTYYIVKGREKDASLCRLIDFMSPKRGLIFCNTKRKVDQLTLELKGKGYSAEALHGDLSQHQRDRVMNLFKSGKLELLLATDVAARGIDVDDVDMVFNYDMPQDMEYYVHRIGRTGRAGKHGLSVSLITPREKYKINSLEDFCKTKIEKKEMPSISSTVNKKAYRNMTNALDFVKDKDMIPWMKIVYKRCSDEGLDPMELAAAFLYMSLGDMEEEIKQMNGSGKSPKDRNTRDRHSRERSGNRKRVESDKSSKELREGLREERYNGKRSKKEHDNSKWKKKKSKGTKNGKRSNSSNKNRRPDKRRSGAGTK